MGLLENIKKTGMFLVDNGLYNTGKSWYSGENLFNIASLASIPLTFGASSLLVGGKVAAQVGLKSALKTGATVAAKEVGEAATIKAADKVVEKTAGAVTNRLAGLKSVSPAAQAAAAKGSTMASVSAVETVAGGSATVSGLTGKALEKEAKQFAKEMRRAGAKDAGAIRDALKEHLKKEAAPSVSSAVVQGVADKTARATAKGTLLSNTLDKVTSASGAASLGLSAAKGTLSAAWNHPKKTIAGLAALDGYFNDLDATKGVTKYVGGKLLGSASSDDKAPGSMPSTLDVITDPVGSLKSAFSSVAGMDPSGGPLALAAAIALTRFAFSAVGLNMPFDGLAKLTMFAAVGYGLYKLFSGEGMDTKKDPSVDAHNNRMLEEWRPAAPVMP